MVGRCLMIGLVLFVISIAIGCGGAQSRLGQPGIASDAGQAAMTKYDSNGDGAIDGSELDKVPALKTTLKRVDKNSDGKVTPDEIDERIAAWKKSQVALTRVMAQVRQNGRPLADAHVTLVPESFLGEAIKPAQGTTDSTGAAHLRISSDPDEAGVHLGYYRIEVSKKGPDGKEIVSPQYNTETILGVEITPDDATSDRLMVDIK